MRSTWFWSASDQCYGVLAIKGTTANLELSCFLEFRHITLTLNRAARSQENVFVVAVNILRPVSQPCDSIVVDDFLPFARHVGFRNRNALANIDRDVFRPNTVLSRPSLFPFNNP